MAEYFRLIRSGIDVAGLEFAREMNCDLSRATIVRLKPYSRVFHQVDEGTSAYLGIDF